jgi:hypothetical protein
MTAAPQAVIVSERRSREPNDLNREALPHPPLGVPSCPLWLKGLVFDFGNSGDLFYQPHPL